MITKVAPRGSRLAGLVAYLYGRGRADEHLNPHLVAAWDPTLLDVAQDRAGRAELVADLSVPRHLFGVEVPRGHVYHVAISLSPAEGALGDDAWRAVAERTAVRLGFEPDPDTGRAGCRWIAVHHGLSATGCDHIHFVADLVREDGSIAEVGSRDYYQLRQVRAEMEAELGLRHNTAGPGAAPNSEPAPGRAEYEAARRRSRPPAAANRPEPDRLILARRVRALAAGAGDEQEFLAALRTSGLLFHTRLGVEDQAVVGYAVALPAETDESAIFYGGGKLSRDLSLPALRRRWEAHPGRTHTPGVYLPRRWEEAVDRVGRMRQRVAELSAEDVEGWAGISRETAGVLGALSARCEPERPGPLAAASDSMAWAGRLPTGTNRGHRPGATLDLLGVARVVIRGMGPADNSPALGQLLLALAALIQQIQLAHAESGRLAAARASQRALTDTVRARPYLRTTPAAIAAAMSAVGRYPDPWATNPGPTRRATKPAAPGDRPRGPHIAPPRRRPPRPPHHGRGNSPGLGR